MKKYVFPLIIFLIIPIFSFTDEEEILKIDASVVPKRLYRGQEGNLVLKLSLDNGINIMSQPSFTIELSPSDELIFPKDFFTASDLGIEVTEENGKEYLNIEKPIEILFTVSLDVKQGNHTLEGRIKYFASSKKENWCVKNISNFSASFYTRSKAIKKSK